MKQTSPCSGASPGFVKFGVMAAEEDTSISALLAARLEQIVRGRKTCDRAEKRALARLRGL